MEGPVRYESLQEPLDDEERELMDPDNWDWDNPIEGVTVGECGSHPLDSFHVRESTASLRTPHMHRGFDATSLSSERRWTPRLTGCAERT